MYQITKNFVIGSMTTDEIVKSPGISFFNVSKKKLVIDHRQFDLKSICRILFIVKQSLGGNRSEIDSGGPDETFL